MKGILQFGVESVFWQPGQTANNPQRSQNFSLVPWHHYTVMTESQMRFLQDSTSKSDSDTIGRAILLLNDPDIRVRGEAFCSLILNKHDISHMLSCSLSHPARYIRGFCALVLANRQDTQAAVDILPLAEDPVPMVRECALGALGYMGYEPAKSAVMRHLVDVDPQVRRSALKAALDLKLDISGHTLGDDLCGLLAKLQPHLERS